METQKSHQRQLVDGSDPTYKSTHRETRNPTNGSWWMRSDPTLHGGPAPVLIKLLLS
jgi:hypothetical protein